MFASQGKTHPTSSNTSKHPHRLIIASHSQGPSRWTLGLPIFVIFFHGHFGRFDLGLTNGTENQTYQTLFNECLHGISGETRCQPRLDEGQGHISESFFDSFATRRSRGNTLREIVRLPVIPPAGSHSSPHAGSHLHCLTFTAKSRPTVSYSVF